MRYFLNINASVPITVGGLTFTFEPVTNRGGSWLGVLAVDEDSAANTLAGASGIGVEEISFERYDTLKKKQMGQRTVSSGSRVRLSPSPEQHAAAARLVEPRAETRGNGILDPVARPVATSLSQIILGTTEKSPPREPLLEQSSIRKPRRFSGQRVA